MKKSVTLLSIGLASLLLTACASHQSQESSWDAIKEKGVLKVATPGTYQPTSFYNDDNELVGYEVDMVKEIGKRLDIKVKFVETGFDQAFTSVDSGRVDISLNNFDITPKRQKKYNISTPYKYGVGGMIVRADGSSNMSKKDLSDWKGKKSSWCFWNRIHESSAKAGSQTSNL